MNERPILFSVPMIRAILAGHKTQTRRVVKLRDPSWTYSIIDDSDGAWWPYDADECGDWNKSACPYGQPGDRLWVRETFLPCRADAVACRISEATYVCFRDGAQKYRKSGDLLTWPAESEPKWKPGYHRFSPSIHMPRWASRILLEITEIRVQRLQEISDEDAVAEGIGYEHTRCDGECGCTPCGVAVTAFRKLWDSINAKRCPWESNPWVWVVAFKNVC